MTLPTDAQPWMVGNRAINAAMTLPTYTVTTVPSAAMYKNRMIVVSNGNAGQPCLAMSNGTSWLRIPFGAAVAAS